MKYCSHLVAYVKYNAEDSNDLSHKTSTPAHCTYYYYYIIYSDIYIHSIC